MLNIIKNTINRVFASGVDSDASAFITATGLSGTTQKSAITTLVKDLKSSGLWSKMKAVYPMVTDNRNLLSYTEDFSNAYWLKSNISIITNSVNSPNGTLNADTITESSTSGIHAFSSDLISFTNGLTYSFSIYAKNAINGRGLIQLTAYQITSTAQNAYCNFDIINGIVGGTGNATGQIQDVGNGWFRCTMIVTSGRTYTERYNACLIDNINSVSLQGYLGSGKSLYIWGAQLEQSSTATTYQPIATTPSAYMASQMKYNLKDPRDLDAAFRLTWSGGWTYSATGAQPNGTNGYADTKLVPSAALSSQNSTHLSYYINQNAKIQAFQMGVRGLNNTDTFIGARFNSTQNYNNVNSNVVTSNTETNNVNGFLLVSRTNASNFKYFKNSSLYQTNTATSTALSDVYSIYLGSLNLMGTLLFPDNTRTAFATIGDGLTDAEAAILYQLIQQYQTDLSRQV